MFCNGFIGATGVGVPRNALLTAQRINTITETEIFDPRMRAIAFYASMAHDRIQLCGRALMEEGQGEGRGDERLTAELARGTYVGDIVGKPADEVTSDDENNLTGKQKQNADLIEQAVMATAFDTSMGSQNVTYPKGWKFHPERLHEPETQTVLIQELVAAADLLGPSSMRGPLGALEYCVEQLALKEKSQLLQKELGAQLGKDGHVFIPDEITILLQKISDNDVLRTKFIELVAGQIAFFSRYLNYSDNGIRAATNGWGIKELFPDLEKSLQVLQEYHALITYPDALYTPRVLWEKAHADFQSEAQPANGQLFSPARRELPIPAETDANKAQTLCAALSERFPTFKGAYQFGTPGGADLDLRLSFADSLPFEHEQEEIRREFQALNLGVEVDILFIKEDELRKGEITDLTQFAKAEAHLRHGFDPHYQQAAVGDTSLFSAYIFATMQRFYEDQTKPQLLSPDIAIQQLKLSRDGAVGWTHYYTAAFLNEYKHYKENMDLSTPAYQKRLAKFFSRVTLGSTFAQLTHVQLEQIQPQFINAIRAADQTTSSDEKMAEVLLSNDETSALLSDDDKELLETAGKIRSGEITNVSTDFIRQAESMLFYNAYQQGIERRLEPGQEVDYLTSFAFEMLSRNPSLGAQRELFQGGEAFITQCTEGKSVYYIPLMENIPGVRIVVQPGNNTRQRVSGSLVGEGPLFGIKYRSGTVTAIDDDTQIIKFDASTLRDLLTNSEVFTELKKPVIQSADARTADVLLQYFAREAGRFVKETLPYTTLPETEDTDALSQPNPLDQYNLGDGFHDIVATYIGDDGESSVTKIAASAQQITLFDQGQENNKLYVVSKGTVTIRLETGEEITLQKGEVFGESALLGTPTTGSATLSEQSSVLAIDGNWFQQFTQTRQPLENLPPQLSQRQLLPRHFLYHLAYVGYDRVRRRLTTQMR